MCNWVAFANRLPLLQSMQIGQNQIIKTYEFCDCGNNQAKCCLSLLIFVLINWQECLQRSEDCFNKAEKWLQTRSPMIHPSAQKFSKSDCIRMTRSYSLGHLQEKISSQACNRHELGMFPCSHIASRSEKFSWSAIINNFVKTELDAVAQAWSSAAIHSVHISIYRLPRCLYFFNAWRRCLHLQAVTYYGSRSMEPRLHRAGRGDPQIVRRSPRHAPHSVKQKRLPMDCRKDHRSPCWLRTWEIESNWRYWMLARVCPALAPHTRQDSAWSARGTEEDIVKQRIYRVELYHDNN